MNRSIGYLIAVSVLLNVLLLAAFVTAIEKGPDRSTVNWLSARWWFQRPNQYNVERTYDFRELEAFSKGNIREKNEALTAKNLGRNLLIQRVIADEADNTFEALPWTSKVGFSLFGFSERDEARILARATDRLDYDPFLHLSRSTKVNSPCKESR